MRTPPHASQSHASPPYASPDDIDIGVLWITLRRRLPGILALSALAGALTYGTLSTMAPRYTSEAQLSVVAKGTQNPFADPKRDGAAPDTVAVPVDKEAINTHVRALMSPDLARRIADEMQLNTRKEFNAVLGSLDTFGGLMRAAGLAGPRPGESEQDRVLGAYFKGLEVYSPKESRFIGIRFTSADAQLAADIANRIAETYRGSLASMRVVETDEVRRALEPKIADLVKEVAAAEAEVERFRGQTDRFVGGPQRTTLVEQQLGELTAELTRTSAARSEAEARARAAREHMKSGSAEVLPDIQRSPLVQSLVQSRVRAERQIAELSVSLLPGHPRMQQLNADLAGLKRQINGEVAKLIEGLEKEAKAAVAREESVRKSIDALKSRVVSSGGDDVMLRQLEAAAKSKRAELDRLQSQFEANKARATPGAVPVEAQIITQAWASSVPTYPRKGPYSGLIAAATLLFGLAWTISKGLFVGARSQGNSVDAGRAASEPSKPARRVEPALPEAREPPRQAPVKLAAALVPVASAATPQVPQPVTLPGPQGGAPPATVAGMAERIVGRAPPQGGYRVLITGDSDTIDATAEAIELARAITAAGKQTLLVDWALDGSGLAGKLALPRSPGLTDLLQGAARFEDVIRRVPSGHVHFLAAGAALDDAAGALDGDHLNLLLDALDEAYDTIVVTGAHGPVRQLFEVIQGRFDCGILVGGGSRRGSAHSDPPDMLLGFEVTDIDILRIERPAPAPTGVQRFMRRGAAAVQESRPA